MVLIMNAKFEPVGVVADLDTMLRSADSLPVGYRFEQIETVRGEDGKLYRVIGRALKELDDAKLATRATRKAEGLAKLSKAEKVALGLEEDL